jgi:hypothetical protein
MSIAPTLPTTVLRDLTVDPAVRPRGQTHLSAASALVCEDLEALMALPTRADAGRVLLRGGRDGLPNAVLFLLMASLLCAMSGRSDGAVDRGYGQG